MRVNPDPAGTAADSPTGRARVVDIARAAGVSTATVDRVLNKRPGVRDATVQRVLKAAGELDYLPEQALYAALAPQPLRLSVLLPAGTFYWFHAKEDREELVMLRIGAHIDPDSDVLARIDLEGKPFDGYSEKNKEVPVVLHEDRIFE